MNRSFWNRLAFATSLDFVISCSGGGSRNTDAGNGGDAGPPFSACGHPGDQGNDAGVGKYCQFISDCPSGLLCSTLNNNPPPNDQHNTYFCVLVCDPCNSRPGFCGAGASCVCQAVGACGCTPNNCSSVFPDGGNPPCGDAGTPGDGGVH
jgi:hypothetical protein